MIPPLASIIGSGFLIAGPLLGRALAYAVAVAHYLTLLGSFQSSRRPGRPTAKPHAGSRRRSSSRSRAPAGRAGSAG
jgi:hypothetical protein